MRKNSIRKFVHAVLDLIPLFVIPIFAIYTRNESYNSNIQLEVRENKVINNFNQLILDDKINGTYTTNGIQWKTYNSQYVALTYGHIYVARVDMKVSSAYNNWFRLGQSSRTQFVMQINNLTTDWQRYSYRNELTLASGSANNECYFMAPNNENNIVVDWKNLNLFDLTQMFGEGNEPDLNTFNSMFTEDYYSHSLGRQIMIQDYIETYNDTDVGSQFVYTLYNATDKYFNMNNVFNMNDVYDWFVLNIFGGNAPLGLYIVWNIVLYEFVMDLLMLLYGVFMFFIDCCTKLIEKPLNAIK